MSQDCSILPFLLSVSNTGFDTTNKMQCVCKTAFNDVKDIWKLKFEHNYKCAYKSDNWSYKEACFMAEHEKFFILAVLDDGELKNIIPNLYTAAGKMDMKPIFIKYMKTSNLILSVLKINFNSINKYLLLENYFDIGDYELNIIGASETLEGIKNIKDDRKNFHNKVNSSPSREKFVDFATVELDKLGLTFSKNINVGPEQMLKLYTPNIETFIIKRCEY